jgi:pyruvate/2-oxoglutarate/acetoin dehydrogenase E1 component
MGGSMAVTQGLLEVRPGRGSNTPISEMAIVGNGIGAASGLRPIVEIMYEDFSRSRWSSS